MGNSTTGNIIKSMFVLEGVLTLVKKHHVNKANTSLRNQEVEKRKLCYAININSKGEKIAYFRKTLATGEVYTWEEVISQDPFKLYSIIK